MEDYLGPLEGERETIIGLPKTLTMDLLLQAAPHHPPQKKNFSLPFPPPPHT